MPLSGGGVHPIAYGGIAHSAAKGETIYLPDVLMQPISTDDVVTAMADATLAAPANGMFEIAGPERLPMATLVRRYLEAVNDLRKVVSDPKALYCGIELNDESLVPGDGARIGAMRFDSWLSRQRKVS
jgi:uncharacterized protein YbjT (DUF2867 family)